MRSTENLLPLSHTARPGFLTQREAGAHLVHRVTEEVSNAIGESGEVWEGLQKKARHQKVIKAVKEEFHRCIRGTLNTFVFIGYPPQETRRHSLQDIERSVMACMTLIHRNLQSQLRVIDEGQEVSLKWSTRLRLGRILKKLDPKRLKIS